MSEGDIAAQGPLDRGVRALPPQHPGQARTMLICETENTVSAEVGHWYSPEKVAEIIAEEREACAKVCEEVANAPRTTKSGALAARDCMGFIRMRSNLEGNRPR